MPEHNLAVAEEVERLMQVGFVKEVQYPEWLAKWKYVSILPISTRLSRMTTFPSPKSTSL